jgi:hypothetical protein
MAFDPNTKTAAVRDAMARGDWDLAIRLAARLRTLGEHATAIRRAKDAINNPSLYAQLGYDLDAVRGEAIAAIKDRFSRSWDAVKDGDTGTG